MQKKSWLLGVVAGAILVGCGPSITVTNNVPLNLAYKTGVMAAPKTNQTIILLKPALQYSDNIAKEYSNKFRDELTLKVQSLLENQGYKVAISDVSDKNDLSFAQKKDSYLVLEMNGEVVLRPDPKTTEQKKSSPGLIFSTGMDVTKGTLLSMGYIKVVFVEPTSGEAIDSFMVDLSELYIKEPFIRSSRSEHTGGLLSSLYKGKDDSNDAVKRALNQIFKDVMAKMDTKLTQDRIKAYAKDVADLKAQKKY
ncbi:HpaA family protein [Helicobacter bizzozeronii]|uniref:Neuraminyllactose-binding hemagglutinin n=1 Tax=Helicobacter bizzozeronii (strain CIII-1) TaxID=1002804 RepID=F8KSC6_HELBC|nr:HpaA family protein [Helicobacter bizzozeronii]CCB79695.1 flagellar sheath adhesin hpaA [Helicobacter bizzozeronii CIII-1]